MQCLTVFSKVLSTSHQTTHLLQNSGCTSTDLAPGATQTMNRGGSKCGDDRSESGKVVQGATFLVYGLVLNSTKG